MKNAQGASCSLSVLLSVKKYKDKYFLAEKLFSGQLSFSHFNQLLGHIAAYIAILSGSQVTLISLFVVGKSKLVGNLSLETVQSRLSIHVHLIL